MQANKENFDAIIIGSGIGGLVTASQLAAKGAKVFLGVVEDLSREKGRPLMLEHQ